MTVRKKALVTGGATGIGRSAVLALARAGFDVAINYASSAKAAQALAADVQALGGQALLVQADVSDEAAVRAMMKTIEAEFGHLDALVNNSGTTAKWKVKDLESLDMGEWDRTFAVNVRGTFHDIPRKAMDDDTGYPIGNDMLLQQVHERLVSLTFMDKEW